METEQIKTVALIVMALALVIVAAMELIERARWARFKREVREARERAVAHIGGDPVELYSTMDGLYWAARFLGHIADGCDIRDVQWVYGWFANAIMKGYDEGFHKGHKEGLAEAARSKPPEQPVAPVVKMAISPELELSLQFEREQRVRIRHDNDHYDGRTGTLDHRRGDATWRIRMDSGEVIDRTHHQFKAVEPAPEPTPAT